MALEVEIGVFAKDASGSDGASDDITVGFDPKGLLVWGIKTVTAEGQAAGTVCVSMGFVDDADVNRCVAGQNEDNSASVNANRKNNNNACLLWMTDTGGVTPPDVRASVTLGTAEFTITYDANDSVASLIHWMAFGGDDITGVQVGTITKTGSAAPTTQSVTFDADCQNIQDDKGILFLISDGTTITGVGTNMSMGMGMGTSPTKFGTNQVSADDGTNTGEPRQAYTDDMILAFNRPTNGVLDWECDIDAWTSTGVDLHFPTNDAGADLIYFLVIKGGQWEVGHGTAKITSTGTKAETTSFAPKGLFMTGLRRTAPGEAREDLSCNIGAGVSTGTFTNVSSTCSDEDGAADMNVGRASSNTKVFRVMDATDQSILSEADVDTFNDNDFTLDYTTVDSSAYDFVWMICGNNAEVVADLAPLNINMDGMI